MRHRGWKSEFPWGAAGPWDVDVAVVGGGPAGLAAAIRLRWLKTFPLAPLSVALINSGPLGGLACLGNSILTGPALAFPAGNLIERLRADLAKWPVPIIESRVEAVEPQDGCFILRLEDGRTLTALSVIVACGMLDLRNLGDYWGKGVSATFGSRQNIFRVLERELAEAEKPVVLGGPHLPVLSPHIKAINPRTRLLVLDKNSDKKPLPHAGGLEILYGPLEKALGEKGGIRGLVVGRQPETTRLDTDRVIIEFNSLEQSRLAALAGVPCGTQGFVAAGPEGDAAHPGLFAAGDCNGPPFSAVVALGQGVEAAFASYRYVYRQKFGEEPALFAYFGDPGVADGPARPDFPLRPELVPVRLVAAAPVSGAETIWEHLDGDHSLAGLSRITGLPYGEIEEIMEQLLAARAVTFLPVAQKG